MRSPRENWAILIGGGLDPRLPVVHNFILGFQCRSKARGEGCGASTQMEGSTACNGERKGRGTYRISNLRTENRCFFFSPTLVGHLLYRGIVHLAVSWCGRAMRSCCFQEASFLSSVLTGKMGSVADANTTVRELK